MKDDFSLPNDNLANKNDSNDLRSNLDASYFSRDPDVASTGDSDFKTPEEVAQSEDNLAGENKTDNTMTNKPDKPHKSKRINLTKKQKIILVVLLIAALSGLLAFAWTWKNKKEPVENNAPAPAAPQEPVKTSEPSKLSGREVGLDVNSRQVIGVMIENSPDARPQSGLKDASVVFEAIAEGGVTRFLALFQDTQPDYIGPIRSARPYYVEWLLGFDGAYAHVGGSPDALAAIKNLGVKDLDQFANAGTYQRVGSRYAPHNVYTSTAKLTELAASKGWGSSTFTGFAAKGDSPQSAASHRVIDVNMSGFLYNPHWEYDTASNSYLRSQAGKPHTDEKSGAQITAKSVIVMVTSKGVMADRYHTTYATSGTGKVFVYQDGGAIEGTWTKADGKSPIKFMDAAGKEIALNPGQRWITVVGAPTDVSVKP